MLHTQESGAHALLVIGRGAIGVVLDGRKMIDGIVNQVSSMAPYRSLP